MRVCYVAAVAAVLLVAGLVVGCGGGGEQSIAPDTVNLKAWSEVPDGFDFLPPLNAKRSDLAALNSEADTTIRIYLGPESAKTALIAEISHVPWDVDHYHYDWDTKAADGGLPDGADVCVIEVWWEQTLMGFVDCEIDKQGRKGKRADEEEDFGLKDGRTLPIKFAIDETVILPQLSVAPTSLEFGTGSDPLTFEITNTGGLPLHWQCAEALDWISLDATSGTDDATVTVTLNRPALTAGSNSGTIAITSDGGDATVSVTADGGSYMIAFVSDAPGHNEVFVMNSDGSGVQQVTSAGVLDVGGPVWSPDCTEIAFHRWISLAPNYDQDIFIVDLATGQERKVLDLPGRQFVGAWLPDGRLAYTDNSATLDFRRAIAVVNVDGTDPTPLTPYEAFSKWVRASADGTELIYPWREPVAGLRPTHFVIIDLSTGLLTTAIDNGDAQAMPSFSPDGSEILYVSHRDSGDQHVFIANRDGTNTRQLTGGPGVWDRYPAFAPDGSSIAFESNRSGDREVYLMDPDGSNWVRLTHRSGLDCAPIWSPIPTKYPLSSN